MKLFYKLLLIIGLFTFTSHLFCQTYFNERYNVGGEDALNISQNILYNEMDIIVASEYVNTSDYFHHKLAIIKLLSDGAIDTVSLLVSEDYSYGLNGFSGGFKRFSSNSYIAVGNREKYNGNTPLEGNIYKFDLNFDTVFTKSTGDIDTSYLYRHLSITSDSSLIVIGDVYPVAGGSSDVLLIKADSLGNELWRRYYNSGAFNMGTNVLSLPDGGYALSCYKWQFQSTISHNYLIRTDSLGNELWRRYIGGPLDDGPLFLAWSGVDSTIVGAYHTADSALTNSDSFNRLALIKVDVDNNVVYDKKFMPEKSYQQWNFYVSGIDIDTNDNIIVVGSSNEPAYHSEGYLFKFSNEGDSLWYRQYRKGLDNETDHYLTGVTYTPDGGYAAVGYFIPAFSDTGNQDVWVIKVDSMGCIDQGDCWVGNREIMALQGKGVLKIYPNPSSGRINIEVPEDGRAEDCIITIWDLYGRKADEVYVPSGQTETVLDISSYPPGLYSIVSSKGGSLKAKGKFIKR